MIDEARRRRERGQDVVIGAVQPQEPPDVEEILRKLEVIPLKTVEGGTAIDVEAIISVKRMDDVSKGGAVFVNERFELIDLREKPRPGEPTSPWYNAGVYAFRPSIFAYTARLQLSARGEYELTDAVRELALSGKKVQALEIVGTWADVRDPEILAQLNAP